MTTIVLDASALLALLRGEEGAKKVEAAIEGARISVVNLAEVISYYAKVGVDHRAIETMLRPLPLDIVPVDQGLAMIAGMLRSTTSETGLSLGDLFCLALAKRDGLPAWTADKAWRGVADRIDVPIVVVR